MKIEYLRESFYISLTLSDVELFVCIIYRPT